MRSIRTSIAAILLSFPVAIRAASPDDYGKASAGFLPQEKVVKPLPPYEADGLRVEYSIVLTTSIEKAVRSFDPDFTLWKQTDYHPKDIRTYPFSLQSTPSAIIGDFNGDAKTDAVLAGRNTHGTAILAVLSSSADTYEIFPVKKSRLYDKLRTDGKDIPKIACNILSFQPKGKKYRLGDSCIRELVLQTDAFENAAINVFDLEWKHYSPGLHWWDGKKFLESGLVDPTK